MDEVSTKKSKWLLIVGFTVSFLLALYSAVGFWVAPRIVQSMGSQLVKEKTGLDLTFQKVRLNPFVFIAVFEGLSLGLAGKEPFLKMAELHVDFELWSLLMPPYRFTSIRLVSAEERLDLLPEGGIDYAPLFGEISEQTERSRRRGTPPQVLVELMSVETSSITVVDPARSEESIITVDHLSGEFTNLSTVKGQEGTYDLRGIIVDIGSIHDSGKLSLAPLRLDGYFEIGPLQLRPLWMLMGDRFGFDVVDGSMRADFYYTAEVKEDGYVIQVRDGNSTLSGLQFKDTEQSFKFGSISELAVRGTHIDTAQKTASVEAVSVTDPELTAWIRSDGSSGFVDALTTNSADHSVVKAEHSDPGLPAIFNGWEARLAKAEARNTIFRFEDQGSEPAVKADIASIPTFFITGVSIDTVRKQLDIQDVTAVEPVLSGWINPDGTFGLQKVLGLTPMESTTDSASPDEDRSRPFLDGWQAHLNSAELKGATITYEDRTLKTPMKLEFDHIDGKVSGLSYPQQQPASINFDIAGKRGGTLAVSGTAGIEPLNADLDIRLNRVQLEKFQPIADTISRLKISSGTLDMIGRASIPKGDEGPKFRIEGAMALSDIELIDSGSGLPIIKQEALQADGIRFEVEPNRLIISEMVDRRPYIYLVIEEDGTTNLESVLKLKDENVEAVEKSAVGKLAQVISQQIRGPVPVRVDSARIEDGMVLVTHKLPKTTFTLKADQIDARFENIDTDSEKMADVTVKGRIDEEALFEAGGKVNPFGDAMTADMTLSVKNYNLVNVNPYARRYVGYGVDRGKVTMELDYSVKKNYLSGNNEFHIRRIELGEKTDSPDAVDAPVEMGVAMLKDRQGNIDLEVPVEGDIKDPDFRIEAVVGATMVGMVGTVVTSPFKIFGGIAGAVSPDGFRMVSFDPGSSELSDTEKQKLSKLAAGFKERPGIGLEIMGTASPKLDRAWIAGQLLRAEIKGSHTGAKNPSGGISGSPRSQEERHRVLVVLYREKIGPLPPALQNPTPQAVQELETALIDNVQIPEFEYRRLGKRRAEVVESYMLKEGGVDPVRMFVVAPTIQDPEMEGAVPVVLSLFPR